MGAMNELFIFCQEYAKENNLDEDIVIFYVDNYIKDNDEQNLLGKEVFEKFIIERGW